MNIVGVELFREPFRFLVYVLDDRVLEEVALEAIEVVHIDPQKLSSIQRVCSY